MRKLLFLFISIILASAIVEAQVDFKLVSRKNTVVEKEQFRIEYVLKGNEAASKFEGPESIKGIDILYGPSISTMHSSTMINGKSTSESSTTYTYVVSGGKQGTYNIPAATVVVGGKSYQSNVMQIKVLPPDKYADDTQAGQSPQATVQRSEGVVAKDDAFIRPILSKTKINEQEAVVVTFRFYTVLNVVNFGRVEFPEFEGFMTEEFDLSINRQMQLEHYNGRNYFTADVKKTLLFPQHSGKITIPAGTLDVVFEVRSGKTLNHPLFGPQEITTEAKTKLNIAPLAVNVSALPDGKPLNFSGGVGSFNIKSKLSATDVKANDDITLKLDITGQGNMKLIKNPEVELDKSFEIYDSKVDNKFVVGANGLSGTKSIEYLFIPRYPGKYTVPAIEFSYFDTGSRSYKTLKTEEYTLNVAVDPNAAERTQATSYTNQSEVKVEQDIRYLKLGEFNFTEAKDFRISKFSYFLWYIIPILLFAAILFVYRKQIKANADIARMKTKRANKVANKRLKLARKYLKENNKDGYYEELMRAIWGYLSDKLTIPVAELSRENVDSELSKYGANAELIKEYIGIIDTCEFARYAPSQSGDAMGSLYSDTVEAIGKMENTIKIK